MAYRDYKPCDLCKNKTFYDADLYNFEQYPATGLYNLGAWKVLCFNCSKNYVIHIVEKDPAAYMTKDGYVYGQHETRPVDADIPLQRPVAMMFKHDKLGTQFTETCGSAVMNHPDWTPLYDHPELLDTRSYLIGRYDGLRELTDKEINKLWAESHEDGIAMQQGFTTQQHYFAHLILKKASEK